MEPPNAVSAIIWDLGGVILRTMDTSPREKWESRFNMEPWDLAKLVYANEVSAKASTGAASVDQIWKHVQNQLALADQELDKLKRDFFSADEIDQELISFIRKLKSQWKSGMITNAWPEMRHYIEDVWKISDAFHHIVISAEVGLVKPDPAIYQLALRQMNVAPEEAVFIDDFVENVEGAQAVGMTAIHFHSADEVKGELSDLLNLQGSPDE